MYPLFILKGDEFEFIIIKTKNKKYVGKYDIGQQFLREYENGNSQIFVILGASVNLREKEIATEVYGGEECEIEYHLYLINDTKKTWVMTATEFQIDSKMKLVGEPKTVRFKEKYIKKDELLKLKDLIGFDFVNKEDDTRIIVTDNEGKIVDENLTNELNLLKESVIRFKKNTNLKINIT